MKLIPDHVENVSDTKAYTVKKLAPCHPQPRYPAPFPRNRHCSLASMYGDVHAVAHYTPCFPPRPSHLTMYLRDRSITHVKAGLVLLISSTDVPPSTHRVPRWWTFSLFPIFCYYESAVINLSVCSPLYICWKNARKGISGSEQACV